MLRFPCASAIKLGVVLYSHARNNHTPRSVLKGFFKLFVLRSYPYREGYSGRVIWIGDGLRGKICWPSWGKGRVAVLCEGKFLSEKY